MHSLSQPCPRSENIIHPVESELRRLNLDLFLGLMKWNAIFSVTLGDFSLTP